MVGGEGAHHRNAQGFRFGGLLTSSRWTSLTFDVRREIARNFGRHRWVTDVVIQGYTAGQAADMRGSIDAVQQISKSKEQGSLADRLHECAVPVRLLVGTLPHPAEMTRDQRELLGAELPDSRSDSVSGSGQDIQEEQPAPAVARLDAAAR
jgi:hypothetical protein